MACLPLLLGACSGGAEFDLDDVEAAMQGVQVNGQALTVQREDTGASDDSASDGSSSTGIDGDMEIRPDSCRAPYEQVTAALDDLGGFVSGTTTDGSSNLTGVVFSDADAAGDYLDQVSSFADQCDEFTAETEDIAVSVHQSESSADAGDEALVVTQTSEAEGNSRTITYIYARQDNAVFAGVTTGEAAVLEQAAGAAADAL